MSKLSFELVAMLIQFKSGSSTEHANAMSYLLKQKYKELKKMGDYFIDY